ncbi:MAG: kelch repeat-containing protein [Bacteroidota bacterium]
MEKSILILLSVISFASVRVQTSEVLKKTGKNEEAVNSACLSLRNLSADSNILFTPHAQTSNFKNNITIPEKRWGHQLTYDEESNRVLLFGGSHGDTVLKDLWAWNGSQWADLTQNNTPSVNKGVFVYDAERRVSVLFGGADSRRVNMGGTWEWDGKAWKEIKVNGPSARVHSCGVYDRKNKLVIVFGGFGSGLLNDTWAFDGKAWQQINVNGPVGRLPLAMIYDETKEAIVMITDLLKPDSLTTSPKNEMWEWSGTEWKNLHVPVPSITGLQAFSLFGKNDILLYDGNTGTTWMYKSGQWQIVSNTGPGIRTGHTMIYDKKRNKIVLFGGGKADTIIRYNDTWEWDGKVWKEIK